MSPEAEAALDWTPCEMEAGDVTVFSSKVPHRSRANLATYRRARRCCLGPLGMSRAARRPPCRRALLYLTYNAQSEGYLRDEYYRHKRATMKQGHLSLIKHKRIPMRTQKDFRRFSFFCMVHTQTRHKQIANS